MEPKDLFYELLEEQIQQLHRKKQDNFVIDAAK